MESVAALRRNAHLVALFQPGLVDTEGLRAHLAAARTCGLPHAAWLAERLAGGDAQTPEATAAAMADALLRLPCSDFHGAELRPDDLARCLA